MKCEARNISHKTSKTIDTFAEMKENSHPYIYQMKKTDSGKCIFLRNNECTIYQARPLICRFYPFELKNTEESRYIFAFTEECPSIGKGHELNRRHFEKLFVRSTKLTEKNAIQH
jgi:Fe-S-cluster containining protein